MANNSKKNEKPEKGGDNDDQVDDENGNVNDSNDDDNIADPGISDDMGLCMAVFANGEINLDGKWAGIAAEFGVSEDFARQRMGKIQQGYLDAIKDYVPPPVHTQKRNRGEKSANPSPRNTKRRISIPRDDEDNSGDGENIPYVSTAGKTSSAPTRRGVARKMRATHQTAIHEPQGNGDDVSPAKNVHKSQGRSAKRAKTEKKQAGEEEPTRQTRAQAHPDPRPVNSWTYTPDPSDPFGINAWHAEYNRRQALIEAAQRDGAVRNERGAPLREEHELEKDEPEEEDEELYD